MVKAILLAAGLGTRLHPLTRTVPKCLVSINGRALLDIWFERLVRSGIEKILVNTHHLAGVVEQHMAQSPWRDAVVLSHESHLLGTAGTLIAHVDFVGNDRVMLVHADNLSVFDIEAFLSRHEHRPVGCEMTMMLFRTDSPASCGVVELDGRGVVVGFHEKVSNPPSNLANGAVYIIEPDFVRALASRQPRPTDFSTEVIPDCLGRIFTYENSLYHRDIGTPESLAAAHVEYKKFES